MFIVFFLLLIAMSQNINQAIWEYGVLRSMGVTKAQGARIYLYEAFAVVFSASILGILSGFATALLVTSQLYKILEFPVVVEFPWILLLIMLALAVVTTFIAVCIPIKQVNKKTIA